MKHFLLMYLIYTHYMSFISVGKALIHLSIQRTQEFERNKAVKYLLECLRIILTVLFI